MYDEQLFEQEYKQHQKDLSLLEYGEGIALTPDALEDDNEYLSLPPIDHTDRFLFKDDNVGKNAVLSGDIIYEFLMGCESLDALNYQEFELESPNEFVFDLTPRIISKWTEEDDDWVFDEMYILRDVPSGNYRRNYKKEMYYEIPDVFLNIPDCDPEALLMLFTDSNAYLDISVEFDMNGGWRDENDNHWVEWPDVYIKRIQRVAIVCGENEKEIQDILPSECMEEIIKKYANEVMDEYTETLIGD